MSVGVTSEFKVGVRVGFRVGVRLRFRVELTVGIRIRVESKQGKYQGEKLSGMWYLTGKAKI